MEEASKARWLGLAAALSGMAALGLSVLYAAGLVARAGELVAAGFSPQDILPLAPLQQGLARGAALLMDPAILSVAGMVVALFWFTIRRTDQATVDARGRGVRQQHEIATQIVGLLDELSSALPPGDRARIRQHLDRSQRLWHGLSGRNVREAKNEILWAAHLAIGHARRLKIESPAIDDLERHLDASPAPYEPGRRIGERFVAPAVSAISLGFIVCFGDLQFLPFYGLTVGVWGFVSYRAAWDRPLSEKLLRQAAVVALVLFVVAQAYFGARPLQRVELMLRDGTTLRGRLLAGPGTQDGTWYVATAPETIRAVSSSNIRTLQVYRRDGERGRFRGKSLVDLVQGD